jgi:hypothetical protein
MRFIEWIKSLISADGDASHKRFISICAFIALIIFGIVLLITKARGNDIDNTILYILASIVGGQSVLTVFDKFTPPSNPVN